MTEQLGRQVKVERVRINPFALSAAIVGFDLKERDGSASALAFDELYVDFTLSSLFRFAPVIEGLRLAGLHVRAVRLEDKSYSFQDIIDRFASRPPAPGPASALRGLQHLVDRRQHRVRGPARARRARGERSADRHTVHLEPAE